MAPKRLVNLNDVVTTPHTSHRVGGWIPHRPGALKSFIDKLLRQLERTGAVKLEPSVQAFQDLIETEPAVYATANLMISQVPPQYENDPSGGPRLTDYKQMCQLINAAVQGPPPYNTTELVAFPINAILDWSMGTPAGWSFFLIRSVNAALQTILRDWGAYLSSPASLVAFTDGDWMSDDALQMLQMDRFVQPDPSAPGWGYNSWNDWFIRQFRDGLRPVADPQDDKVIVSACESTPFDLKCDVQLRSNFWIKAQPYSLKFMMGCDGTHAPTCDQARAEMFVGGMVYQAFLSAFEYHRWHSPVNGAVRDTYVVNGSYYAESPAVGFDEGGPNLSQSYITNVASRAVMFIEADDPVIGLMCVVAIGMAEVSSNVITAKTGQTVRKGQELGYFQFGGSTHCLVFRPGVIASWNEDTIPSPTVGIVPVNSYLARAADGPAC